MKWIYFVVWIFFETISGQHRSVVYYQEYATRTKAIEMWRGVARSGPHKQWLYWSLDSVRVKKSRPICSKPKEGYIYKFFIPNTEESK